jgi:hypothetical protein
MASSAETILFLSAIALLPLSEPFGDAGAEQGLDFPPTNTPTCPPGNGSSV